jgi:glycosyltransferase involved in cell wall biosynthesis
MAASTGNGVFVITNPRPPAGVVPVRNMISILREIVPRVYLFTGNEGAIILREFPDIRGQSVTYTSFHSSVLKLIAYTWLQVRMALSLIRESGQYDRTVFFMAEGLFLPVIVAKILGKRPILSLAGSMRKMVGHTADDPASSLILKSMEEIAYRFADAIVVYSPGLVREWGLENYEKKITTAHEHFIDFTIFHDQKNFRERPDRIGYVGRLSREKGFEQFLDALPGILEDNRTFTVMVAGYGPLAPLIADKLPGELAPDRIVMKKWVPHNDLPELYNDLKLLVIPSYTEGLPNVMLEAMACGTPVLATPVGAIPDFITDGETGFFMEDNTPESIARNIYRALTYPGLENVAVHARDATRAKFTFNHTVLEWKRILADP